MTFEAKLLLPSALMLFDQRGTRTKNGWKCKKQSAHARTEAIRDRAGDHCCYAAESEAREILVAAAFPEGGEFGMNDHVLADEELFQAECSGQPHEEGPTGGQECRQTESHHELADHHGVRGEGDGADRH